jgi:hypothetical protein
MIDVSQANDFFCQGDREKLAVKKMEVGCSSAKILIEPFDKSFDSNV